MMKEEFERLAGYEVSFEDYNKVIEPMYMATDLSKEEFVKVIDKKKFAVKKEKTQEQIELEENMKAEIKEFKDSIKFFQDRADMCKMYYEDDGSEYWKKEYKRLSKEIKEMKNRIKSLKWVLA